MPGMAKLSRFSTDEAHSRYTTAYERTLAQAQVAVRQHDVPTTFGSTHVLEAGDGDQPALVLLHAMSFSSTVWVRNLAGLSARRRVLAIDTIGDVNLSRSERLIRSREDYAAWMAEVFAALGVERAAIAGNSYGGWLAANVAVLRPELVTDLVLITPPLVFVKYRPGFYGQLLHAPFIRSQAKAERFGRWFISEQTLDDAAARLWLDQFCVGMPFFRGMARFPRPRGPFSDDALRSIAAPVLLIEGEDEPMHDPAAAIARAGKLMSNVDTALLGGTKHVAELEQPDRVNQLILEHLAH
jgi:pimeloyl-ACP methyl ester carboxylesterase